jgi:hypothetical protein
MRPPPDRPISDPLLRPDRAPVDATGVPVRAPLGNSIRTFLAFVSLALIGVGVWWIRRPDDLTARLGDREWVVTDVDGEPATNAAGTASTFVLDGTGEVRGVLGCNVATGTWAYDVTGRRLEIDWQTQTLLVCPDDWPTTYLPDGGDVDHDGTTLRIVSDAVDVRSVSLADRPTAAFDDVAGVWTSGTQTVEIGARGLLLVDTCRGTWSPTEDGAAMAVRFDEVQRDDCSLGRVWTDATPVVPVVDGSTVYLRRDRATYPLDRGIIRLDPEP